MGLMWNRNDGGPESKVRMFGLEIKGLCSILLLKFGCGSRDAWHAHAFNSISWVLSGALREVFPDDEAFDERWHFPSLKPVFTYRTTIHKVYGWVQANWVLTFRGPWANTWREITAAGERILTHGRREVLVDQTKAA